MRVVPMAAKRTLRLWKAKPPLPRPQGARPNAQQGCRFSGLEVAHGKKTSPARADNTISIATPEREAQPGRSTLLRSAERSVTDVEVATWRGRRRGRRRRHQHESPRSQAALGRAAA